MSFIKLMLYAAASLIVVATGRQAADGARSVIIVGAGTAGISAGRYLLDRGYNVTILEGAERIGGRVWTFEPQTYPGKFVELGAFWIHGGGEKNHPITEFCENNGIKIVASDAAKGAASMGIYPREASKLLDGASEKLAELNDALEKVALQYRNNDSIDDAYLEALRKAHPAWNEKLVRDQSYMRDVMSVRDYGSVVEATDSLYKPETLVCRPLIEDNMGAGAQLLSIKAFAANDPFEKAIDQIVPSGYRSVLERMVNGAKATSDRLRILLNERVIRIAVSERHKALVSTRDGSQYMADQVIVSASLGVLRSRTIEFVPKLPNEQLQAIDRIGFGHYAKVLVIFERAFWPDDDYFLPASSDLSDFPGSYTRLYFVNLNKLQGIPGLLAGVGGPPAAAADRMGDSELYARSTYSYYMVDQKSIDGLNIRKPLQDTVFFAGEHTMWPESTTSTVHGAYLSGIRAAREITGGAHSHLKCFSSHLVLLLTACMTVVMNYYK